MRRISAATESLPSDLIMLCSYELDHLDAASFTFLGGRHCVLENVSLKSSQIKTSINHLWVCPVPGVMASGIVPGVALKTVNRGSSWNEETSFLSFPLMLCAVAVALSSNDARDWILCLNIWHVWLCSALGMTGCWDGLVLHMLLQDCVCKSIVVIRVWWFHYCELLHNRGNCQYLIKTRPHITL